MTKNENGNVTTPDNPAEGYSMDETSIPPSVFSQPLSPDERPSAGKRVLEVVMLWGGTVMNVGHYFRPEDVTIGDSIKNNFRVSWDKLPADDFPLVRAMGGEYAISVIPGMDVQVMQEDNLLQLADLETNNRLKRSAGGQIYTLGLNDRCAVQVGNVTFVIQYVSPAKMIRANIWKAFDWYFPKILTVSAMAHVALIIAMFLTPAPQSLGDDVFKNPDRFAKLILTEQTDSHEKQETRKEKKVEQKKQDDSALKEQLKYAMEKKPDQEMSKKKVDVVDAKKREQDRKIALNSGLLSLMKGGGGGAVSNVFGGGGGLGTGINNAMGSLQGDSMDAGGAGGLGSRGTGAGGMGGALGIGGIGTYGHGKGRSGGFGIDLGGKGKRTTRVVPGRIIYQGALSREQIGKVINRYLTRFKYCYEKELNRNPNLQGKISVYFVIGGTGSVNQATIRETQMNDANVEQCLLSTMRQLKFPQPKGGGIVEVTYPFIFQPSGG